MRLRFLLGLLVFLLACVLPPVPARADDDVAAAREHYTRGTRQFDLLHYPEAAREFELAYEAKPDPAFLYNMAQAYRLAGDKERAIGTYRSFLRRMPNAKNRAEVEQQIASLQKVIDDERAARQADPSGTIRPGSVKVEASEEPRSPPAKPGTTTETPGRTEPPVSGAPPSGEAAARPGFALKVFGASALAVGVAAAATGLVFGLQAQAAHDEIANPMPGVPFDPSVEDRFKLDRTLSIALLAGGGAVAVTGAVLMVLGVRAGARPRAVTVLPAFGAGPMGVVGASARIEF